MVPTMAQHVTLIAETAVCQKQTAHGVSETVASVRILVIPIAMVIIHNDFYIPKFCLSRQFSFLVDCDFAELGDNICHGLNNYEQCNYDGGDCCSGEDATCNFCSGPWCNCYKTDHHKCAG